MMFMALPKAPALFRTVKTMTKWSSSLRAAFRFENTANLRCVSARFVYVGVEDFKAVLFGRKLAADGGNVGSARARHLHGGHRRVDRFGDLKAVTVDIFSALSESLRVAYHLFNVPRRRFCAEQILHDLNFSGW